jgi:hypothetical protein
MSDIATNPLITHSQSQTYDTRPGVGAADAAGRPLPDGPVVDFSKLRPEVRINPDRLLSLPPVGGRPLVDVLPELQTALSSIPLGDRLLPPPALVQEFIDMMCGFFSLPEVDCLVSRWPPVAPDDHAMRQLLDFLTLLSRNAANAKGVIYYFSLHLAHRVWYSRPAMPGSVKVCFLCQRRHKFTRAKRFYWATITRDNIFEMQRMTGPQLLKYWCGSISAYQMYGAKMRLLQERRRMVKKVTVIDRRAVALFQRCPIDRPPPFPLTLRALRRPVPVALLRCLQAAIVADDMLLVRSLPHLSSSPDVRSGVRLASALLEVFEHAGKVHQLLLALVGHGIGGDSVDATTVCRENCQMTNIFKMYFQRFARAYYENVLRRIIAQIEAAGDIGLKRPETTDRGKAADVLWDVLDRIIGSADAISPQIRHLASVLKTISFVRFNSTAGTYNTLSRFFFTRFVAPVIADPLSYDNTFAPAGDIQNFLMNISIPFSQFIQGVFTLSGMGGRFEALRTINMSLNELIFPRLVRFTMSLGDVPQSEVQYSKPSVHVLNAALECILDWIADNFDRFADKYTELMNDPSKTAPGLWGIAGLLVHRFPEIVHGSDL